MRIRARKTLASPDHSVSLSSPSSSSSILSSSSITAANSSQDSSISSSFSPSETMTHRCHGLDLLVKAMYQVTGGSVIGVPYIQRRVIIRRRRRTSYSLYELFEQNIRLENEKISCNDKKQKKGKKISMAKRRSMAMGEEICNW